MSKTAQSYPFPVLGPDRMDYASGIAYKTSDWEVADGQAHLRHQIDGDSLVSRMVTNGRAQFGVAVVMKATMYRRTFVADSTGELSVAQSIPLEKSSRSIELPKLMPMVVYKGEGRSIAADKTMGLDELWLGQTFSLPKGAILARDRDHEFMPSIEHLIRPRLNNSLRPGEIQVEVAKTESGYFVVHAHPDLYAAILSAQTVSDDQCRHRDSILTHALSVGFAKLAKQFGDDDEDVKTLENFQSVKRRLGELGVSTWEDESDSFDSCKAACTYYPHLLVVKAAEENGDD